MSADRHAGTATKRRLVGASSRSEQAVKDCHDAAYRERNGPNLKRQGHEPVASSVEQLMPEVDRTNGCNGLRIHPTPNQPDDNRCYNGSRSPISGDSFKNGLTAGTARPNALNTARTMTAVR